MVTGETLLPHSASVMSSTRRTETPARYISMRGGFLHAAFPAAIPLDDSSLEGHALEPRHVERDVAGGRGEAAIMVAAAAALTGLTVLVACRLRQGLCLLYAFSNLRKFIVQYRLSGPSFSVLAQSDSAAPVRALKLIQ